jgi:hypothetical protein
MDFSWDWVTPGLAVGTTEPLAKARPELARPAMPQAMRPRIVGSRPVPEKREQGLHQRLR